MNKSIFAKILDCIFVFFGAFLLTFYLLGYYIDSAWLRIIMSVFISLIFLALILYLFGNKNRKEKISHDTEKYFEKLLFFGDEQTNLSLLNILKTKYDAKLDNGLIKIGNVAMIAFFSQPLSVDKMAEFYAKALKSKSTKLIIICGQAHPQTKTYINRLIDLKTIILEKNKSKDFLLWLGFNEPMLNIQTPKKGIFKNFSSFLSPDKAIRYFALFIFFMGFSFVVSHSVYYIIFASIMFSLSILSRIDIINRIKK